MRLKTEIEREPSQQPIGCRDGVFVLGSCFAENIGGWLADLSLDVCQNPFGVIYNPASIASALMFLINKKRFAAEEMVAGSDGMFYSFAHHGRFAAPTSEALAEMVNANQEQAEKALERAKFILITFGTSWVYERGGEVVANCHKFPAREFVRRLQTVEEIVATWTDIIAQTDKRFIFTVSPIRHLKDGLHGNQLSKATLLLAIDQLCLAFPERVEYAPIYELMIDDLRDYRFYADDMVHPSGLAVEIVKEYFAENFLDEECRAYVSEMEPLVKSLQHRPFHPESEAYKTFLQQTKQKIEQVKKKYRYV